GAAAADFQPRWTSLVIMARSVPAGSSHFPAASCKLRAGNGQELIGYFLCNSGRNPATRNLPEPTQISTDPVAGMIDLGKGGIVRDKISIKRHRS
ncbi:unnamed protein product, partial [Adineta ricciae]